MEVAVAAMDNGEYDEEANEYNEAKIKQLEASIAARKDRLAKERKIVDDLKVQIITKGPEAIVAFVNTYMKD
jgi:hypothetical protein